MASMGAAMFRPAIGEHAIDSKVVLVKEPDSAIV
jgi:hypothetical protein